ncbi:hypothetical protein LPJ61_005892, partial [Coemansia biformis]
SSGSSDLDGTDSSEGPGPTAMMALAVMINHLVTVTPADNTVHTAKPMFPSAEHLLPYSNLSEDSMPESFLQLVLEHGGSMSGPTQWQSSPEDPEDPDYKP